MSTFTDTLPAVKSIPAVEVAEPAGRQALPAAITWREVWRLGIAPQLSTAALEAIRTGLLADDARLIQGQTAQTGQCPQDVVAGCGICYGGWQGDGLDTWDALEVFFAKVCFETDFAIGYPCACSRFLNWHDETPRDQMRAGLLPEVERALAGRRAGS